MRTKIFLYALSIFSLVFVACSSDSNNGGNAETMGKLTLQLTDAPFPFDMVAEANVTLFKVDARLAESEDEDREEAFDDDDGAAVVVGFLCCCCC